MRRPYRYHRPPVCLCAVIIIGGCNQYGTRPEIAASADSPAVNIAQHTASPAQFDLPAILDELVGSTSPYCPVASRAMAVVPPVARLGMPESLTDLGNAGVCVVEASQLEAAAVLLGSKPNGKASGYLP